MLDVEINLMSDFRTFGCFYGLSAEESRERDHDEGEGEAAKHFGFG